MRNFISAMSLKAIDKDILHLIFHEPLTRMLWDGITLIPTKGCKFG